MADGKIESTEEEMLHRMGTNLGLTDTEMEQMIRNAQKESFIPPVELSDRFYQVYYIVKMILADGVIANSEMRLATGFALKLGFSESEIPTLLSILIAGVRNKEDEEDLFIKYKKQKLR